MNHTFLKRLNITLDPFEAFSRLQQGQKNCFCLEFDDHDNDKQYVVMGILPKKIFQSSNPKTIQIDGKTFPCKNSYEYLKQHSQLRKSTNKFSGLYGYVAFEAMQLFEPSLKLKRDKHFPLFAFGLYEDGIVIDQQSEEVSYFSNGENRKKLYEKLLNTPSHLKEELGVSKSEQEKITSYKQQFEKVKKHIRDGNAFQVVLSEKEEYGIKGNDVLIYKKLREEYSSPYMFYLRFGSRRIIGSSPEVLVESIGDLMRTYPLAGTIGRGKSKKEDEALAQELKKNTKEIAEHSMLVDLHRNDFGRIAVPGTVKIEALMQIKKLPHVQHIESIITAEKKKDFSAFDILSSCFPAGTLSGAPKIESIKIIADCEHIPRGPYGGAVGRFSSNGDMMFCIPIRSVFRSGNYAYTQVGSGIVQDSTLEGEQAEMKNKLRGIRDILGSFITPPFEKGVRGF